jgi:hypothetical protein
MEEFDSSLGAQMSMLRQVDLGKAPGTEQANETVLPKRLP